MTTPGGEQLGEVRIDVDMDTDPAMRALRDYSRQADRQLRDIEHMFIGETDIWTRELEAIRDVHLEIDVDTDPANRAIHEFGDEARQEIEETRGRFEVEGRRISRSLDDAGDRSNRFGVALRGLGRVAAGLGGVLGKLSLGVGAIGAAAGTAVPLLASVATAVENIAPAGAVAATGILAVVSATATLKLGMAGVQDAITSAFDTSAKGPEKFQKALDKLSPSAREFATTVKTMEPAFTKFQQSIQQQLFTGLSDELKSLSTAVLPVLRTSLSSVAKTLNTMALGAAGAAAQLGTNGTLGTAMAGASAGLSNLSRIPAQVVTALGQLAAAGAPAFQQLTSAVARVVTRISDSLSGAFRTGALQDSVSGAVDALKGLGEIAGNVFGTLRNVLGSVSGEGGGAFTVLTQITQALQDATATKGFQQAMQALAQTMGVIGKVLGGVVGDALKALGPVFTSIAGPVQSLAKTLGTALGPVIAALGPVITTLVTTLGPLLESALSALSPVLVALGPPIQALISALGVGLSPIIDALGPVLLSAASAIGSLVVSLAPLLPVIGNLIASLLPPLVPLLDAVGKLFTDLAPVITQVGSILTAVLAPVIASLPGILQPFIDNITQVSAAMLPLISTTLTALTPALVQLATAVAQLAVALVPVLTLVSGLAARLLTTLTPVITPLIQVVGRLATVLATVLAGAIRNVVVPAVNIITNLLRGNFSGAGRAVISLVQGIGRQFLTTFNAVKSVVSDAIGKVISLLRGLGSRARAALGDAKTWLVRAGRDAIQGLINGMGQLRGAVSSKAKEIAKSAINGLDSILHFGSPSKEMIRLGKFIGQGLVKGMTATIPQIKAAAKRLAQLLRDAVESKGISKRENSLLKRVAADSKQLQRLASDRDKIGARLKSANDKLNAIEAKYAQVRSSIADKILSSGEIIQQGNAPVTATGILDSLKAAVKAAQDFQKQLAKLKARGLRADLLEQIASAGVEAGSATASALVNATPKQLAAINKAQKQLASVAKKTGTSVADALYGAGIKAAQGLVDGLASQQDKIEKQMEKIARAMIRAIRKELKIKSPSRAMEELGTLTGDGLVRGLTQSLTPVKAATNQLGQAVSSLRTTSAGSLSLSPAAAEAMVLANRSASTTNVAAPKITVMIGNRVIDEHVRVVVDRANATAARQQVQGVRR